MSVVDTNVLVRAHAPSAPEHARARSALLRLQASGPVYVSRQIVREFLAVISRPQAWAAAEPVAQAAMAADYMRERFNILEDGKPVWDELLRLSRTIRFGGKQVHDANIVATMLAHGETRLLTFNAADFRRFEPQIELIEP